MAIDVNPTPPVAYSGTVPERAAATNNEAYANSIFAYLNYFDNTFVTSLTTFSTSLDTWAGQLNTTETNINAKEASAVAASNTATASANNKGSWSALTGALNIPASVNHNDSTWILNTNLADVTLSEPTDINTDWTKVALNVNSATNITLTGSITEEVYNLTGTVIDPTNGTIEYKVLSAATTFTENLASGQGIILRLAGGDAHIVTFPATIWVTGVAPILTANDVIVFWKEGTTLFGSYLGTLVQA